MSDPPDEIRINMHAEYFEICRAQVQKYERLEAEIQRLGDGADEQHIIDLNKAERSDRKGKAALIAIPFAAMCLEAFIYDYGASNLSDSFFDKHLDRLSMTSKWVLTTKLVTGQEFPRDSQAFEGMRQLEKDRNRIVHFKSMGAPIQQIKRLSEFAEEHAAFLPRAMYNGYTTVLSVMKELDKLDPGKQFHDAFATDATCHA